MLGFLLPLCSIHKNSISTKQLAVEIFRLQITAFMSVFENPSVGLWFGHAYNPCSSHNSLNIALECPIALGCHLCVRLLSLNYNTFPQSENTTSAVAAKEGMLGFLLTHAVKNSSFPEYRSIFFPHHVTPPAWYSGFTERYTMKCRPQTHKSGSTGWQAVVSWEVNEEAMTFAPATFEIQTLQGGPFLDELYSSVTACWGLYISKELGWLWFHLSGVQVTAEIK